MERMKGWCSNTTDNGAFDHNEWDKTMLNCFKLKCSIDECYNLINQDVRLAEEEDCGGTNKNYKIS